MKKKLIISISLLLVILIAIVTFLLISKKEKTFYLDDNYYGSVTITEIEIDDLNKLIDDKKSFAVFIYQPMCITSADFENVLSGYIKDNQLSIYKIAFSKIKSTDIGKSVKYYPSFIIFNKGEMVDFLEADKDEDVEYYTSKEGFGNWFTKYVKIKTGSSQNNSSNNSSDEDKEKDILENVNLEDVVREDNKINIYFFYGKGCPHCQEEFEFLNSIQEEYGDYYNLYTFETWYNDENVKLLNTFAFHMGDKVTGVPYTIIGKKRFSGFREVYKKGFIEAIEQQHQNGYDVYFDKIKSN